MSEPPVTPPVATSPDGRVFKTKVLHVLRHGVAMHNLPEAQGDTSDALLDAPLHPHGYSQVEALRGLVRGLLCPLEVCVVSPLTRTLQTALHLFQDHPSPPPFKAMEVVREAYGIHKADKRRSRAELEAVVAREGGGLQINLQDLADHDTLWQPEVRETLSQVGQRAQHFLSHVLLPSSHSHVLLVSHGVFLQALMQELGVSVGMGGCGQHPDLPAPGSLQLLNGQLYTMVLVEMPPPSTVRTLFLRPDALSLLHEGLASQACGNKGPMEDVVCWLGQLFLLYSHGHYRLGKEGFSALLTQCGLSNSFVCERYFLALLQTLPSPSPAPSSSSSVAEGLSFEQFVLGLVAMDPNTPHTGQWRTLRTHIIFSAYDTDDNGRLDVVECQRVMEDMMTQRLTEGQGLDRAAAHTMAHGFLQATAAQATDTDKPPPGSSGLWCSRGSFLRAVSSLQLTGTSLLLRTPSSPLKADLPQRQSLLTHSPKTPHPPPPSRPSLDTVPIPPTPPPTVKVASRHVNFNHEAQRYSLSPHDKGPRRKLAPGSDSSSPPPPAPPLSSPSPQAPTGGGGPHAQHSTRHEPPALTPGQASAWRIVQWLLDQDPEALASIHPWLPSLPSSPAPPPPPDDTYDPLHACGVFSAIPHLSLLEPLLQEVTVLLASEPSMVSVRVPARVFGDIHGQIGDLLRLFRAYGRPDSCGDVMLVDYVFNGDFVDRGAHSCEVVLLLLALKLLYPRRIFLIRGNHESRAVNHIYGFLEECRLRLGDKWGRLLWELCNTAFDALPLAALVEGRILVVHGGLGTSFNNLDQVRSLCRPIVDGASGSEPLGQLLRDVLWSDPTDSDHVLGVHDSARGEGIKLFGPDRVHAFCRHNNIDVIIRSHQAVDNGYEFFADKALITVFSATNYCGRVGNDGAVLEVDKDLVITPKIVKNKAPTPLQGPQHMHRQQAQATSPTHHDAPLPPRWGNERDSSPPRVSSFGR